MGRLGVGEGTMVVAYDEDASMAPRVWWLLRHMGHDAVAVLDGGIAAWREAGGRLEGDVPAPRARRFTPKPRPDLVVDVAEVRRPAPGTVLLDARAPERYRGEVEPIDPRAGHIPGAVSAPFREALDARGRWLEEEEHRRRFDRLAPPGTQLVAYCGSGVTACATLLALEIAGRTGGRLYAGSFSDWASYPEHDVRVGDVP
jgi:thiosulfate/3-mercaptopyruvate sulfurtransferase